MADADLSDIVSPKLVSLNALSSNFDPWNINSPIPIPPHMESQNTVLSILFHRIQLSQIKFRRIPLR